MNLLLEVTDTGATSISIDGSVLNVSSATGAATLTSYAMMIDVDPVAGTSSFSMNGFLSTPDFTGTVQFATGTSVQLDSLGNPTTGVFLITGADGATINMNIVSADQVELDIDLDGDGTVDEVVMTTLDDLQA